MDEQAKVAENQTGLSGQSQPVAQVGKTFTQEDVNRMMAAEKEQGRRSILKELGVEDIGSAKESLQKYQEYLNSQKTELEQAQANQAKLQTDYATAIARASHAENCLSALKAGANSESLDDLVTIAMTKVSDSKNFEAVISEMKSNSAYAGFFTSSVGTGNGGMKNETSQQGTTVADFAKGLAEKSSAYTKQKSSYFKLS